MTEPAREPTRLVAVADDPLLTRQQVADLLGVGEYKVRQFEANGIPAYHFGSDVRFHREEILRWWKHGRYLHGTALTRTDVEEAILAALGRLRLAPAGKEEGR